jgi:hypothetical protein
MTITLIFYDPGTRPTRITPTLTADDVIRIITDPDGFEARQRGISRGAYGASQALDREKAGRESRGEPTDHGNRPSV